MERQGKMTRLATRCRTQMSGALVTVLLLAATLWGYAAQAAETTTYVLTDAQGTVLAREDAHGTTIATYDYRPYGKQQAGPATAGPGYTGHVGDPDTELVYMQARYYDPMVGRFLTVDKIAPVPGSTFSFNRYSYGLNNPVAHIDPDGNCPDACVIEGGVLVTAGAVYVVAGGLVLAGVIKVACGKLMDAISGAGKQVWQKITQDHANENVSPMVIDHPGNNPPFTGQPGSTVRGGTKTRTYGPDGYPETDRELGHPDEKGPGSEEHSHDWDRPEDGGPPRSNDRGPPRPPRSDDPPSPRGPNVPPPKEEV